MIKYTLKIVLSFIIILVVFTLIDGILLNHYAGGEIHRILAHPHHQWLTNAFQVLIEYIITMSLLVSLFILGKYPCHWSIIAMEGVIIVFFKWWNIRYFFFFQQEKFGLVAFSSITLIFLIIIIAWLFHRLRN